MNKNSERTFPCSGIIHFKDRLVEAMAGESSRGFAAKCGLSDTVIRNYLSGKTYPSLDRLEMIAKASGKPAIWFISGVSSEDLSSITENKSTHHSAEELHDKLLSILNLMSNNEIERAISVFKHKGLVGLMPLVIEDAVSTEGHREILRTSDTVPESAPATSLETMQHKSKKAG